MKSTILAIALSAAAIMPGAARADLKTCTVAATIAQDVATYRDKGLLKTDAQLAILSADVGQDSKAFTLTIIDLVFQAAPNATPREIRGLIYETCVSQLDVQPTPSRSQARPRS